MKQYGAMFSILENLRSLRDVMEPMSVIIGDMEKDSEDVGDVERRKMNELFSMWKERSSCYYTSM